MNIHKKQTIIKQQSGFTLVELLLVMALFAMLLTALTDMFVSVLHVQSESETNAVVMSDGRYILSRVGYDITHATAVSTPAAIGGSGASLVITVGGNAYTYALSGGNLQLTNNNGTNNLNTSETTISGLTFQRIGNAGGKDTIRMTFTVTSKATSNQGAKTETFTTTVGRR